MKQIFYSKKLILFFSCIFLLFSIVFSFSDEKTPLKSNSPAKDRENLVAHAKEFLGTPYLYGGITLKGIDCSGLVYSTVLETLGQAVPRSVAPLQSFSIKISKEALEPGDLVFFKTGGSSKPSHIGFYLGNDEFIHAASSGNKTGVIISKLSETYWAKTYSSCGRLLPSGKLEEDIKIAKTDEGIKETPIAESKENRLDKKIEEKDDKTSPLEDIKKTAKERITKDVTLEDVQIEFGSPFAGTNWEDRAQKHFNK